MARGWESKAVEAQIEAAQVGESDRKKIARSPMEIKRIQDANGLRLSRTRILNDIRNARNPRYRAMLEEALKQLERQLATLEECPE